MSAAATRGALWDEAMDADPATALHKPRNPFTGELNDADPADYCPAHGGIGAPSECEAHEPSGVLG